MSSDYIKKEVQTILDQADFEYPLNLAMSCAWLLGNLKGINLKVLDTQKMSSLADYFVMASATNTTQLQSMAETIVKQMREFDFPERSIEGLNGTDWVLIDLGDVLVHIFLETSRGVYDLDNLWMTAKPVTIPNEYYFSSETEEAQESTKDDKDYF
jgi:ribosome-associated protein